jgi:predicted acylesterase/phospholipase RssA
MAALQDCLVGFEGNDCHTYVGSSSGANLAAALAAGKDVERIYRAFLDPADDFFPLERKHILRADLGQLRRTIESLLRIIGQGSRSLLSRPPPETPAALWEELSRIYDSVPPGLFSLDGYERFLEENFVRRTVPLHFSGLSRQLRILAHDLDSGDPVVFGAEGTAHVPIARACVASMATPPLFAPVRIGDRHYFNPGPSHVSHVDVAIEHGARVVILINPMIPIRLEPGQNLRDKGALRVANQAHRIKLRGILAQSVRHATEQGSARVIVIEPDPADSMLFGHNPPGFAARRALLEQSFHYTRGLLAQMLDLGQLPLEEAGWSKRNAES